MIPAGAEEAGTKTFSQVPQLRMAPQLTYLLFNVPSRTPPRFLPSSSPQLPEAPGHSFANGKGSHNDSSPRADVFVKGKKKVDLYVVVIHWFGGDGGQESCGASLSRCGFCCQALLMENAKCSNFLCRASISPWGYSSHLPPQHPGGRRVSKSCYQAPHSAAVESTLASFFF